MEKKNNQKEIHLTKTKHLDLYIILFIGAVAIASIFLVLNIFGVFTKVDSYTAIKATVENGLNYDTDITCVLHFKGNVASVNSQKSQIVKEYTSTLKQVHMRVDSYNKYAETTSIAEINYNVGNVTQLDPELYEIIREAYNYSNIDENNYSIFAAPLYDEWLHLCSYGADDNYDTDPINSDIEKQFIEELTNIINDTNNYSLEFLENNSVKLTISEAYKTFRDNHEIDSPIISLNVLENLYKITAVKEMFEENGYTNGYLSTMDGYGVTLKDLPNLSHAIYNVDVLGEIGYINIEGNHVFKKTQMFHIYEGKSYKFYEIKDEDNKTHYRNLSLNLKTGYPNEFYLSTMLFKEGKDLIGMAIDNQKLMMVENSISEKQFINYFSEKYMCLNHYESPKTYEISNFLKEKIYLFKPEVYTINNINKEE